MARNDNTTIPQSGGATCTDNTNDGLVAGLVICIILLVALGAVLMVILAKHKGWINRNRFNFKIPKFGGIRQNNRSNDGESSTYQERLPPKNSKINTPGNMSYDMSLPINAGTGTGSENVNKGDDSAGTRTSTVSGKSYLELIVEPSSSQEYENVSTPTMRNKVEGDHGPNVPRERGSDVYINYGSDFNDDVNGGSILNPGTEDFDEIYSNVETAVGNSNNFTAEEGDHYFVLEKDNSDEAEMRSSNQENENYFVLEPQNATEIVE